MQNLVSFSAKVLKWWKFGSGQDDATTGSATTEGGWKLHNCFIREQKLSTNLEQAGELLSERLLSVMVRNDYPER